MDKSDCHDRRLPTSFKAAFAAVVVLCAGWAVFAAWAVISKGESIGIFGDAFGALNAVFSGLAFTLFWYTVYLQRREIALQREELSLTRDEMTGQKEQLRRQAEQLTLHSEAMARQNFETTFFSMLSLHNEIVNSLTIKDKTGRLVFPELIEELKSKAHWCLHNKGVHTGHHSSEEGRSIFGKLTEQELSDCYEGFYKDFSSVGHYFRNLYNIVKFVKNSGQKDKRFYTNIIRAQLSNAELALLFYNCLSDKGREKFKPLIEEFAFLNEMDDKMLLADEHKGFYDRAAFDSMAARAKYPVH